MNYFYKCSSIENKEPSEHITLVSHKPQIGKALTDSLIIQFVSAFSEDKPNDLAPPMYLQILLSECCQQSFVQELRQQEVNRASKIQLRRDPNHARRSLDHFMDKIYGNPFLELSIKEWWDSGKTKEALFNTISNVLPCTKEICTEDLASLIIDAPFFKMAIALYIDVSNREDNPVQYFSTCGITRRGIKASPLKAETDRIRLLYKFVERYWIGTAESKLGDVKHGCDVFLKEYLDIDIQNLRVGEKEYYIEMALNNLMSDPPVYKKTIDDRKITQAMAHKAHHFFKTQTLSSIGIMRLARFAYQAYTQEKNKLELSVEQQVALDQLSVLLPYRKPLDTHLAGNISISLHHLLEKNDMLSPESIFDEFEQKLVIDREAGYRLKDYFEACCISLVNQISFGYPLKKCSLCGRFYIARQNRTKKENYCYRQSFENPKWSCSKFHSHFRSNYDGSSSFVKINKRVANIRSYIAKMNPPINGDQFQMCIGILYSWLTVVRRFAKECDKNGSSLEGVSLVLDAIENCRKNLFEDEVQREVIRIGEEVSFDMLLDNLVT